MYNLLEDLPYSTANFENGRQFDVAFSVILIQQQILTSPIESGYTDALAIECFPVPANISTAVRTANSLRFLQSHSFEL